jgi:hypothetical protein
MSGTEEHNGTMNRILALLFFLVLPVIVTARAVRAWSYQEMFDQADLVAIAKPISTKDAQEEAKLTDFSPHYKITAVSTEFDIRVVLKGDTATKNFVLNHYRLGEPGPVVNGPNFVAFDPKAHHSFLLFLKKEAGGRYAPVSGQSDPALFSVMKLEGIGR